MSHFEEFLTGMALVHGSMEGVGLCEKDLLPVNPKFSMPSLSSMVGSSPPMAPPASSASLNSTFKEASSSLHAAT